MSASPAAKKVLRIGLFSSLSRSDANGIARYQWQIVDFLEREDIQFNLFGLIKNKKSKFLRAVEMAFRFLESPFYYRKSSVDLVWGPAHKLPLTVPRNIPCVLTIHDLAWKKVPETMPPYRRFIESLLMPIALKRADLVISVSQSTADDLFRYFPECKGKVRVIPLGGIDRNVDPIESELLSAAVPDRPYVLFVGTIEPRKNLHRLLDAFSSLADGIRTNFKLVIAGDEGWGGLQINSKIESLKLTGSVILAGKVSEQALRQLYKHAYCLAMPSLYEGFGLPIVEAHSFSVPVITSNCSSMPEVAGDGALYVEPLNVSSIGVALKRILSDASLRDELSRKALINSRRFSWERAAIQTREAFHAAFERRVSI
jgi:glycosyltransferase involved in cell wall biosynthesis